MSSTWLHGIECWDANICPVIFEYQNSHAAAPVVWDFLVQKYTDGQHYNDLLWQKRDKEFWGLAYREDIPSYQRNVMLMTYDRAVIHHCHVGQAVKDIRAFVDHFPLPSNKKNHWVQIAEDLENSALDDRYVAFGFCMNTIGESFFQGEEFYDGQESTYAQIDWKKAGFWSIYPQTSESL